MRDELRQVARDETCLYACTVCGAEEGIWLRLIDGPVLRSVSCSWCRTLNPDTARWCAQCGHAAHKSRMACDCPQCTTRLPLTPPEAPNADHAS
jgi:hypothetical protein